MNQLLLYRIALVVLFIFIYNWFNYEPLNFTSDINPNVESENIVNDDLLVDNSNLINYSILDYDLVNYSILDSNCVCNGFGCLRGDDYTIGGSDISNVLIEDDNYVTVKGFSLGDKCSAWPTETTCPNDEEIKILCGAESNCIISGSPNAPYCLSPTYRSNGGWLRLKLNTPVKLSLIQLKAGYVGYTEKIGMNIDAKLSNGTWIKLDSVEFSNKNLQKYNVLINVDEYISEIHLGLWSWQISSSAIIDNIVLLS